MTLFRLASWLLVVACLGGLASVGCLNSKFAPPPVPTFVTPTPWPATEIISLDVTACPPGNTTKDSHTSRMTFAVEGLNDDGCVFDYVSAVPGATDIYSCKVPQAMGRISVSETDQGNAPRNGFRYGIQYSPSFDLFGQCTLEQCGPNVVYPADCPRGP